MDTYFAREHDLPSELRRLIFEFATLRAELSEVRLRPLVQPVLCGFNTIFFRNWQYIYDQVPADGTYYIFDEDHNVRAMYVLH